MGSLLNEYRKRHKLDFVWGGIANGVCFFNKNNKPHLICLVSEPARALTACTECPYTKDSGKVTLDIVKLSPKDIEVMHDHVHPDTDLNALVTSVEGDLQPFMAKNFRELEVWLWTFFMKLKPFAGTRWQKFRSSQKGGKGFQAIEQMMWAATHTPNVFRFYYHSFYSRYLLGRNYLMYK